MRTRPHARQNHGQGTPFTLQEDSEMSNVDFGIVMTVVGMGSKVVVLLFLGFVITMMKKLFPVEKAAQEPTLAKESGGANK